jgi:hypothetical protein
MLIEGFFATSALINTNFPPRCRSLQETGILFVEADEDPSSGGAVGVPKGLWLIEMEHPNKTKTAKRPIGIKSKFFISG